MFRNSVILFTFLFFYCLSLNAQESTRWRGPDGNGIYKTGLLRQWPESGPEIIWYYEGLGEGHSSPAFAKGLIYLSGMVDGEGYIFVLNSEGKLQWKASYGKEFTESYPGSRSTPVIAGDLLYIYSGLGVLTCMDSNNGKIKWKKDAFNDLTVRILHGESRKQWLLTETSFS